MKEHVWTWPIASYLFLGGLGASMTIIAAVADVFFGTGHAFALSLLASAAFLAFGSFLLIFELGRPFQFWRVFSLQKAVLTFGAWMVGLLIVINVVYFSFWVDWFPWKDLVALRCIVAVVGILVACGVLLYTGIELSSMKGRVLWNTPALPVLFSVSGLLTGVAANALLYGLWPFPGVVEGEFPVGVEGVVMASTIPPAALRALCVGLIIATLIISLVYILMMYTSSNTAARNAAKRWLKGSYFSAFWGGLVVFGLLIPLVIFMVGSSFLDNFAFLFVLLGGVFLRFLVVYSDDRRLLPGEDVYWNRLPKGDEPFMGKDWG